MTLLKSTLLKQLGDQFMNISEEKIKTYTDDIINLISNALVEQKRVIVHGFGIFFVKLKPPHRSHNPLTGKHITAKAKYRARFKASETLSTQVNKAYKRSRK